MGCGSGTGSDSSGSKLNVQHTVGGLLKMSQTVTVFYFSIHIFHHFNHKKSEEKVALILRLNFVCFQKLGLLYSRVGAGAA
jgi:hypothetical protein